MKDLIGCKGSSFFSFEKQKEMSVGKFCQRLIHFLMKAIGHKANPIDLTYAPSIKKNEKQLLLLH